MKSPGGQVSTLTTGEVAGMGKAFSTGGQLLMGFANQVVFNFVGKNPIQPTVQSSLPLSFVQPFLRGAGRAVVLENLTQAERSLLYQVRTFAKFRQEFIVDMLTGGTISQPGVGFALPGFSHGRQHGPDHRFHSPCPERRRGDHRPQNLAYFEQLAALYEQLIEGESSGLSQLQVDQVRSRVLGARSVVDRRHRHPAKPQRLVQAAARPAARHADGPRREPLSALPRHVHGDRRVAADPKRKLEDIPKIVNKIPALQDIVLDGHSLLGPVQEQRRPTSTMKRISRPRCRRRCGSPWNIGLT